MNDDTWFWILVAGLAVNFFINLWIEHKRSLMRKGWLDHIDRFVCMLLRKNAELEEENRQLKEKLKDHWL